MWSLGRYAEEDNEIEKERRDAGQYGYEVYSFLKIKFRLKFIKVKGKYINKVHVQ